MAVCRQSQDVLEGSTLERRQLNKVVGSCVENMIVQPAMLYGMETVPMTREIISVCDLYEI